MGLFNNYSKPGKGISKNEREKNVIVRFFELYFRKFWSLCILNLLVVLCIIPFAALSVGIFYLIGKGALALTENIQLRIVISMIPFAFFGPIFAGALRITRDYVREEPVFFGVDFLSTIKKNFKQTVVFSIISYFATAAFSYAIPAYYYMEGALKYVLFPLVMIAAVIFLFCQYYYYIMAITCDLTVKQLLKNSIIISIVCFFRNITLTIIVGAVVIGALALALYGLTAPILFAILMMLILFFVLGFLLYSISFIAFPAIKKYIIDPFYANNETVPANEETSNEDSEENPIPQEKDDKSEYVYHNGRMIHRSVLDEDALFDDSLNDSGRNRE